ncbi:type VI secretion system needle protein Hcp [Tenacibaculum sp. Bg11-29]|uniref:type VI secretion system tube protein TssD n=1 Tax=Tenacibaculum sp. Bg11-29 TaxID=2058306 RepID=UPI000C31F64F|nr:type VI secretion system tube protein TssD [Tenacibaculum sp. Bg11-29]PKH51856.1 type VI secretion system needle protein Hcp [Tenacibaculum sp. Bg11-29]
MGSFRASLELGGKEFDVLATEYEFSRDTDKKGKIASNVYGGRINITIESTADSSVIEAMLNSQFKAIEGKIVFKKSEEDSKMKEVEFKNAYIVYYKENLHVNGDVPMTINFTVSAEQMTIGNAAIDNRWPVA